jgi:anaerobic magnesium-protoporphyrin IX monomethyl ester cyclase
MLFSENIKGPVVLISKEIQYSFPFSFAYLAGYLMERNEDVKILFLPNDPSEHEKFIDEIIGLNPLLVGLGSLYPDIYPVGDIIKKLKQKKCQFPIVIGGQMVTPTPEFITEITKADYGVISEGEITLYNLVVALRNKQETKNIKGLIVNDNGKLINTGPGEFITDMTKLPQVPYELFPKEKWLNIGHYYVNIPQPQWRYNDKVADIHGGRGCPYSCNFCYHHSRPRYRPIPEMMKDAKRMIEKYDVNMLYFDDDLVLASPNRAKELIEGIKQLPKKVEFTVSCRFDILDRMDDELLSELRKAGLRNMGLGVESGSQKILDIIGKRITVEQIKKGLRRLKKIGILPSGCIQVGQLSETNEDVQESMSLMLETLRYDKNINWTFVITTPFPGTELYKIALEKGLLKDHLDFYNKFSKSSRKLDLIVNLSKMTNEEIKNWQKKLESTYKKEKRKLNGNIVWIIERIRIKSLKLKNKIIKLINFLPNNIIIKITKKIVILVHDATQTFLDYLRLLFLGIKRYE